MMDRRSFLAGLAVLATALLLGKRDLYVPVGHLTGFDDRARDVDYVTLDGHRIESDYVFEADDVAGWVSIAYEGQRDLALHSGTVRYHWKAA